MEAWADLLISGLSRYLLKPVITPAHHTRVRIDISVQALLVDKDIQETPWGVLVENKTVKQ